MFIVEIFIVASLFHDMFNKMTIVKYTIFECLVYGLLSNMNLSYNFLCCFNMWVFESNLHIMNVLTDDISLFKYLCRFLIVKQIFLHIGLLVGYRNAVVWTVNITKKLISFVFEFSKSSMNLLSNFSFITFRPLT